MQNRWNILFAQTYEDIDGLERERFNSIADALELHLFLH